MSISVSLVLPPELWLQVLSHVDAKTLTKCREVSRGWSQVASDNSLWQRLYVDANFQSHNLWLGNPDVPWISQFVMSYKDSKSHAAMQHLRKTVPLDALVESLFVSQEEPQKEDFLVVFAILTAKACSHLANKFFSNGVYALTGLTQESTAVGTVCILGGIVCQGLAIAMTPPKKPEPPKLCAAPPGFGPPPLPNPI